MSTALPPALGPLRVERDRLDQIIEMLGASDDSTTRADLAAELVRSCSRYEDVKDRCVYPALEAMGFADQTSAFLREEEASIRDAMEVMRKRTAHISAVNARADDPEGFDDDLNGLSRGIKRHLEREQEHLFPALVSLSPKAADELADGVSKALKHASEKPKPSHNRIGRAVGNLSATLDRTFEDASTPPHPGRDQLDETEST